LSGNHAKPSPPTAALHIVDCGPGQRGTLDRVEGLDKMAATDMSERRSVTPFESYGGPRRQLRLDRMKVFVGLASVVAFLAALACFAAGSSAARTQPAKWTTLHAARSPATVQLPASWQIQVPRDRDIRLVVADPTRAAQLAVIIGPNDESWGQFYARLYKLRRTEELARDPHASIRTRVVNLPAGRAFESIVVRNDQSIHQRLREVQLDFLKDGKQYEFEYFCLEKMNGIYVPIFDTSAHSIRLTN